MSNPTPRVVLLGASNLTRGISPAVEVSRNVTGGGPVEMLIAMGHGRSYGARSRILARALPGITECGLWDALGRSEGPTYALLTDVGNDIAYGSPPEVVCGWVRCCIDRLREHDARIAMSLLPLGSLRRLPPWRFRVLRSLLFPGRSITLDDTLAAAEAVDDGLREIAGEAGVAVVEPLEQWYGIDAIHLRRTCLVEAWSRMASAWRTGHEPGRVVASPARWLRLRTMTPRQWWLAGRPMGRPQPAGTLPDGTTVALF